MYKSAVKRIMPANAYEQAAVQWRVFRGWRERHIFNLTTSLHHGVPDLLVHFGIGPGDDMLCTIVLRELQKRHPQKIWMMSKHAALFDLNPDVDQVVPIDDRYRLLVLNFGKQWRQLEYAKYDQEKDQSEIPQRHITAELCWRMGIRGPIELHPHLYIREWERAQSAWARGCIAIQSSGLGGQWPMLNKQWFPARFQQVVDALKDRFRFIQLGSVTDPPLNHVIDQRGKTSLRETAAILEHCRVFVGNAGFQMHLARAVECPSVIIYGGREAPWQSGYTCNVNLYSPLACAPCWRQNTCDFNRMCMDQITAADVIQAIEHVTARKPDALKLDVLSL